MSRKPTLCWKCARACGKCSWSNLTFTPVEGWKATREIVKDSRGDISSFHVHSCPEFEQDLVYQISNSELASFLKISIRSLYRNYTFKEIQELKKKYLGERKNDHRRNN